MSDYIKQTWVDNVTPIDAEHLNHMEEGIGDAVLYTDQYRTDREKAQARRNIEAAKYWYDLYDKPFYEDTSTGDVLLEETEIVGEMLDGEPIFIADLDPSLFRGDEVGLTITFDGSEYPCERKDFQGVPIFGNAALVGGEDTGEPFMFVNYLAMGMCGFYLTDAEPHAISITVLNIERKKIENKFIDSEWLATYSTVSAPLVDPGTPVNFNGSEQVILQSAIGDAILEVTLDSLEVDWNGTIYTCPIMQFGPGTGFVGMNLAAGLVPSGEYPFGIIIEGPGMAVFPSAGYEGTTNVVGINLTSKLPNKVPPQFLPLVDANNGFPGAMSPEDKQKLDSLKNVEAYTHPTHTSYSSGLYKISVNNLGHVSAATAVSKSDITALGIPAQDTTYTHPSYTSRSSGLYKITVDSSGHVSAATAVSKSDITALGIAAIPSSTTADDGKLLRVVNGVAAWVALPYAEEAEF